jgi:hypothetical protein
MTKAEWIETLALMRLNWPHVAGTDEAVAEKWFCDLQHLPGEQVKVAVETMYRDGREFPPNAAQILGRIVELGRDELSAGEAWRLAHQAARIADPKTAEAWLIERSPAAAEAVRQISGAYLSYRNDDEPIVRAQFRDIFNNVVAGQRRDDLYAGLPTAGLRGLESGPRKLGAVLKRALPKPPPAIEAAEQADESQAEARNAA